MNKQDDYEEAQPFYDRPDAAIKAVDMPAFRKFQQDRRFYTQYDAERSHYESNSPVLCYEGGHCIEVHGHFLPGHGLGEAYIVLLDDCQLTTAFLEFAEILLFNYINQEDDDE